MTNKHHVFNQQVYTINLLQPLFLQCPGTTDSLLPLLHSVCRVVPHNSVTPHSAIILAVVPCRQKGTVRSVSPHINQTKAVY